MTLPRIILALVLVQLSPMLHASTPNEPVTVIRNARVFDGVGTQRSAPQDVLIRGGRIEAMGRTLAVEPGARTLMPGLIDAHAQIMLQLSVGKASSSDAFYYAYVSTLAAKSFLDSGFTTVRDMSGSSFSLKQAIDEGSYRDRGSSRQAR